MQMKGAGRVASKLRPAAAAMPIVSSSRVVVIASGVSLVASALNLPFSITSGIMAVLLPITSARPSLDTLITAGGGAGIALATTWCGVKVAEVINLGVRAHEHRKRAGDGTVGFVSAVLCVLLVAISAEASSETPTRIRLLFGSATSCAFLACAMSILGEVLHTFVSWMKLGQWGWTGVTCVVIAAIVMTSSGRTEDTERRANPAKGPGQDIPPSPKAGAKGPQFEIPNHY